MSVTPVKSLGLIHPERVTLTEVGVPGDRLFHLVDERGALFTASSHGPLVSVWPSYDPTSEWLELRFPGGAVTAGDASVIGDTVVTDFHGRPVPGHLVEGPWSGALTSFVGKPVRLARCDRPGDGSDDHHLTLVSLGSVRELAGGGGDGLDPRRFRMLFELDGCGPHEEDTWEGFRVGLGGAVIRVHGQVPRCVVTTLDPETGVKDFDTLRAIRGYRTRMDAGRGGLPFGMYAEVEEPGDVAVGDVAEAL